MGGCSTPRCSPLILRCPGGASSLLIFPRSRILAPPTAATLGPPAGGGAPECVQVSSGSREQQRHEGGDRVDGRHEQDANHLRGRRGDDNKK